MTLHAPPTQGAGPAPSLDALVADLPSGAGRLRAWSLVVTLFGDAVAPRGGVLRVAALQAVLERLGVEPGALRTALSRLARDGWLARDRRGRASFYALTPAKSEELAAATRRIYAAGPPLWNGDWQIASPGAHPEALTAGGFAEAAPGLFLRPRLAGASPAPVDANLFDCPAEGARATASLIRAAWPETVAAERMAAAEKAARALAPLAHADPLEALAARTLLIHLWRRAVLASSELPAALQPPDWPGERARNAVRDLYWRLAPASERWLDACFGSPDGALPSPDGDFHRRFGGAPDTTQENRS